MIPKKPEDGSEVSFVSHGYELEGCIADSFYNGYPNKRWKHKGWILLVFTRVGGKHERHMNQVKILK